VAAEQKRALAWGVGVASALAILLVLGSGRLAHFDAALVCYTFATLFAAFGITYRWVLWLQRPPTAMYWRRGRQVLFLRKHLLRSAARLLGRFVSDFVCNRFIFRRGKLRGAAHVLIMWGCTLAVAITVPLVFGWVEFRTVPEHLTGDAWYRVFVFGLPHIAFPIRSALGFVVLHVLVWPSLLLLLGVVLALRRRLRDHGAAALQQFGEDFLPLILLFAISATGLMLTADAEWMDGHGHEFLAILHAVTVIFTLLWVPFGKFFHIFQRPLHLAVGVYQAVGRQKEQAKCRRCGEAFASRMQVEDLITVEEQLGYRYTMKDTPEEHYQWICPRCRRALLGLAQAGLWQGEPPGLARRGLTPPLA
jgi:hypothetical protein